MRTISAGKYHSYGNDFLIVAAGQVRENEHSGLAAAICHPHFGVGADGCVFPRGMESGRFRIRIFNRDGSEAGMSGNGARCACAFLHRHGLAAGEQLHLDTLSGPKVYELLEKGEGQWRYRSRMGKPDFSPAAVPCAPDPKLTAVEDYPLQLDGEVVRVNALSMGNPQCVVLVKELPGDERFRRLGSALETHPFFPDRTNVSFVRIDSASQIRIRIWERGVGPTCSSGTGSCGAAVVSLRMRRTTSPVLVETDTGSQQVMWKEGEVVVLTGSSEFIADVKFYWD